MHIYKENKSDDLRRMGVQTKSSISTKIALRYNTILVQILIHTSGDG